MWRGGHPKNSHQASLTFTPRGAMRSEEERGEARKRRRWNVHSWREGGSKVKDATWKDGGGDDG